MSVQKEIDRINKNVADTYTGLSGLGATMPAQTNTANLPKTVAAVKAVLYQTQTLQPEEKKTACGNIGATQGDFIIVTSSAAPSPSTPDNVITLVI